MRTAVCYFSGTGNTKRVVQTWKEALEKTGIGCDLYAVTETQDPDLSGYDRIGFAFPIHAFNAPKIMLDFAAALAAFDEPRPAYLIMVSGEPHRMNDTAGSKLSRILRNKNLHTDSVWHYVMPYNMIFRHTEERAWQMDETMRQLVPLDVRAYFLEGEKHALRPIPAIGPLTAAFRIEQHFAPVNGRAFRVTDDCIRCMQCVRTCPVGNISLENGRIVFHDRCILCTRCSFNCPEDAIRIGLLNGWRVNGPYRFERPLEEEKDRHARFLRRSYRRYFEEAQSRIGIDAENEKTAEGTK